MRARIELDVPEWQIGEKVTIYFPDTMQKQGICERAPEQVTQELEGGGSSWWNVCSDCHGTVDSNDKFCRHCGGKFVSGRYLLNGGYEVASVVLNQKVWDILYSGIGNAYGTAGLMGNLFAESGLNPFCITGSGTRNSTGQLYTNDVDALIISKDEFIHDGIAYGLAQWRYYSRKANLYTFAKANFMSIGSTELQCLFILDEIKKYKTVWKTITTATSVKQASDVVLEKYEKPANVGDVTKAKRASYGEEYFKVYSGIKVESPKTSTTEKKIKYVVTTNKNVFVRTGNGTNFTNAFRINKEGTELEWVATAENGWHAVLYPKRKDQVFWISGEFTKVVEK